MYFDNIKRIREEHDLTQREIADILGVKRAAYSLWEIGKNIIPLKNLNDLSNKFNISMDYIVGLTKEKNSNFNHIDIDTKKVGKKIKQARKDLKLTQEGLAKIFNTTHSAISAYENGVTIIPTLFLIELAKMSGKSMEELCCKKDC